MRILRSDLEAALGRLNAISERVYRLDNAYGKNKLVVTYEDSTGINDVTGLHTKRELYDIIYGIIDYVGREKESPRLKGVR